MQPRVDEVADTFQVYAAIGTFERARLENEKTGDARISGSLAALAGLESALEQGDDDRIDAAIRRILLLHSLIFAFGGIPLIYYGDELGTLNDYTSLEDPDLSNDSRWIHRPVIDWALAAQRKVAGTPQQRIFQGLQKMIGIRTQISAFADYNNRELLDTGNAHVFGFVRFHAKGASGKVLVLANFDASEQQVSFEMLRQHGFSLPERLFDQLSNTEVSRTDTALIVPSLTPLWLMEV